MKGYFTIKVHHLKLTVLVLSLCIGQLIVYPVAIAQESAGTSSRNGSLVLLYADLDNRLGLTYQDSQNGQNGMGDDSMTSLRTEIQSQISANPDLTVKLMVAQSQSSQIYTISADTTEQVEDWKEVGKPFDNLTAWLTQSVQAYANADSVLFSLVDDGNGWLQSVRPVIDPLGNPCIANPAHWEDDGQPGNSAGGERPIQGGSSQDIGHTDLEQALCNVQSETSQTLGLLHSETVLDYLAERDEVGTCSSLDSLLPHLSLDPQYIYVSSTSGGLVSGIRFQGRDILRYDMTNNEWSMLFDASDMGINRGNLNAFHVMTDGSILFSLSRPLSLRGLGRVDDSDIVKFIPDELGSNTAGSFELYFDGSDVKLTRPAEDIDAISMLPDGRRLLISTLGNVSVDGVRRGRDEDVLLFEPTRLGEDTQGEWSLYLDGSKVGLRTRNENIVGIGYDPSLPEREALHLATRSNFVVPMLRGINPDILSYLPDGTSQCTFEMSQRWNDFKDYFAGERLDGISYQIGSSDSLMAASSRDQMSLDSTAPLKLPVDGAEGYSLYLPIVSRE